MRQRLSRALDTPTDAAALAVFRFAVGMLVVVSALRFFWNGWIDELFIQPKLFFTYWGFDWVRVPGALGLHALFIALVLLGSFVAVGFLYRVSAALLFLAFVYLQLLDVTNYLNHYYLVALLLGLMALMPLGRAYGVDGLVWPASRVRELPALFTYLLRFQVGCVYVFAGLAKATSDWLLHAQPLNIWLSSRTQMPVLGGLFAWQHAGLVFAWCGFLFDTTIVFFLLNKRARPWAYGVLVTFHTLTMLLFPIGMFPVIMTVAALIFFSPRWPRRFLAPVFGLWDTRAEAPTEVPSWPRWGKQVLFVYCVVQLLLPLRTHLYGANVLWHEQGMRFSWRVMVREKNATVTYYVRDKANGREWFVRPRELLDARQEREFATQPDLVLQLAHVIAARERARGRDVGVRAEVLASLNGRAPKLLVDPTVDLVGVRDGIGLARWITPPPNDAPARVRPVR